MRKALPERGHAHEQSLKVANGKQAAARNPTLTLYPQADIAKVV